MRTPSGFQHLATLSENNTVVWVGLDEKNDRKIIGKTLQLSEVDSWKGIELFEREVETLKQLDHKSIPRFYELIKDEIEGEHRWHIIQEKVEGRTLSDVIENDPPMTEKELREFTDKLLEILIFLQNFSLPLFHRDIKPANLILHDGEVFLIDFGSVRHIVPKESGGSTIVGTNGYLAPEQLMGRVDRSSDLYGRGMTLLHLITGKLPSSLEMSRMKVQWMEDARSHLGDPFLAFVDRLCEPDPLKRFANAKEAKEALQPTQLPILLSDKSAEKSTIRFKRGPNYLKVIIGVKWKGITLYWATWVLMLVASLFLDLNAEMAFVRGLFLIFLTMAGATATFLLTNFSTVSMKVYPAWFSIIGEDNQSIALPFEDVFRTKSEPSIENKKEQTQTLKIGDYQITRYLKHVDRQAILNEMKSVAHAEIERHKEAKNLKL